jgi:hypothetical protein
MNASILEASYPISFQEKEAEKLGEYLRQRQCVNLIGMKRVGISNFLRFFLNHKDIIPTYISKSEKHLFIPVDLNDLIEQEIYPFWTLTLKRIVDVSDQSDLPDEVKAKINDLFVRSIQFQDLFLVIDSIRHALVLIGQNGMAPTIFFLRFDRLKDKFNPSFFDNLQGLRDATSGNLAYVFTSYRSLSSIFPGARTNLSVFSQTMYAKPANEQDMKVVYEAYRQRYKITLKPAAEKAFFSTIGGYMQYLQLGLIHLNEMKKTDLASQEEMLETLLSDERITLQSEELWESLSADEQMVLVRIVKSEDIDAEDYEKGKYLWDTGFLQGKNDDPELFSPLFKEYINQLDHEETKKKKTAHLTRKEHLLFTLLKEQMGEIVERESIVEVVWPESQEFGVSDWAIDRLVARVRLKLREQDDPYEIQTIRTRGYKLTPLKG